MKIAISGKICSGKSTLTDKLNEIYPNLVKRSFAEKIKEIAFELFGMKEKDRKLLQGIGTNMRLIDEDVWVKYLINTSNDYVIIDDLRFENEARLLKENNWILIRLNISQELQKERIMKTYPHTYDKHLDNLNHESEMDISKLDKYIDLDLDSENIDFMSLINFIENKKNL